MSLSPTSTPGLRLYYPVTPRDAKAYVSCGEDTRMYLLLQSSIIIIAVVASNLYWRWTPDNEVAALMGFVAAAVVTVAVKQLRLLWPLKEPRP